MAFVLFIGYRDKQRDIANETRCFYFDKLLQPNEYERDESNDPDFSDCSSLEKNLGCKEVFLDTIKKCMAIWTPNGYIGGVCFTFLQTSLFFDVNVVFDDLIQE